MEIRVDSIEVAIQEERAYIRVHGRGTFKMVPSLKAFAMAAIERGCNRMLVEMEACTGMDSTFMGTLAGLAIQIGKNNGAMVLCNANEKNRFLIKMLGLSQLVKFDDETEGGEKNPIVTENLAVNGDKRELTEAMIQAHEVLVGVAPENIIKFKDVLSFLREDLKSAAGQKGEGQLTS